MLPIHWSKPQWASSNPEMQTIQLSFHNFGSERLNSILEPHCPTNSSQQDPKHKHHSSPNNSPCQIQPHIQLPSMQYKINQCSNIGTLAILIRENQSTVLVWQAWLKFKYQYPSNLTAHTLLSCYHFSWVCAYKWISNAIYFSSRQEGHLFCTQQSCHTMIPYPSQHQYPIYFVIYSTWSPCTMGSQVNISI